MSFLKVPIWFVNGLRHYTKSGYASAAKSFNEGDLRNADMSGKTVIITGSNSGIGKEAATQLFDLGAQVHLVCRRTDAAEEARQEILDVSKRSKDTATAEAASSSAPDEVKKDAEAAADKGADDAAAAQTSSHAREDDVHVHTLDLSEPRSILKFAEEFSEKFGKLDCLVNNAGCMVNERTVTPDGLEKNFAVNTLGTHLITTSLLSLLEKSEDGRVVTVSSGGMLTRKLDTDDLQTEKNANSFDGTMCYAQQKRQQTVMNRQYAKKYPKVWFACMHPGWVDTPAVRTSMPSFHERMKGNLRDLQEGADTIVWLAAADAAKDNDSGLFYEDRKVTAEHLRFAGTTSTQEQEEVLMGELDVLSQRFRTPE